jgi:phage-related protein
VAFEVEYFHERVLAEIESWPVDVLADYARLVDLPIEYGPSLRLPHSRSLGEGLFELRPRGRTGIGRAFYCFMVGKRVTVLHAFIKKTATHAGSRTEAGAQASQGVTPWLN